MEDNIKISEFNELQFKMIRIHKLQDQINELKYNPLLMNIQFGDYNYNIIINILEDLYSEVDAKCTPDEREEWEELYNEAERLSDEESPFETGTHPTGKRKSNLNKEKWKNLKQILRKLNLKTRQLLDNHGYSPDKDYDLDGL